MRNWLKTVYEFLIEWFKTFRSLSPWRTGVAKAFLLALSVAAPMVATDRLVLRVVSEKDRNELKGEQEMQLGWSIMLTLLAVVAALALGVTWARFRSLRIADAVEDHEGIYLLTVTNTGFAEVALTVRLEEIVDSSGPVVGMRQMLPRRLAWVGHEKDTAAVQLCRGLPYKINLFSQGRLNPPDGQGHLALLS